MPTDALLLLQQQIAGYVPALTVGSALTVIVVVAEAAHPLASV